MLNSSSEDNKPWWVTTIYATITVLVMVFVIWIISPWKRVITEPGTETVVMDTPFLFGSKGIRDYTLKEGAEWVWRTTQTYVVNVKPYVIPVRIDDFSSSDNILLDFESAITVQVNDPIKLIQLKGTKWWEDNLERPYLNAARAQVKMVSMDKMMSDQVAASDIDTNLTKTISEEVQKIGLPITIIDINLGRATPNKEVLERMNETAAEQQRQKTMVQSKLAEDAREAQQIAKAKADDAYREGLGLSVQQYHELQLAQLTVEACKAAKECILLTPSTPVVHTVK